jgi:hypothetical protein
MDEKIRFGGGVPRALIQGPLPLPMLQSEILPTAILIPGRLRGLVGSE